VTYALAEKGEVSGLYAESYFQTVDYPDYLGQEPALRRSMRRHLRQMSRHDPRKGALLEIGCAYGLFLDEARGAFSSVMGLDVADVAVQHAREKLHLNVRAEDFLESDLDAGAFDVVCLWDTIEHLARPDLFLAKVHRVLSPDGLAFLTTGDIGSWNAKLRGRRWRHIHPPSHLHYFSRATIRRLLERLGFEVLGAETAAYYHTLFNILASIRLYRGAGARVADVLLRIVGRNLAQRVGLWLNLGDTMFVAARARSLAPGELGYPWRP
jgi:SAM-dependent methyltransferase